MKTGHESEQPFSEQEIVAACRDGLMKKDFRNKRVLAIIPDTTRSGPTGLLFNTIARALVPVAKKIDFMIALGTHPPYARERLFSFLGLTAEERKSPPVGIFQHEWENEDHLCSIGTITGEEMATISGGLMKDPITVTINKKALEYDELILCGPVFPHEVVGYSGGYKYLFPGISGPAFLNSFHWLGALITNPKINGTKDTPVRRALNKAASLLSVPVTMVCYVVNAKKVHGLYTGDLEAWSAAADLSAKLNVTHVEKPFHTIFSMAPVMYEDIWTAGKCMYKLEPVVADGGTLIIYAPHIKEVSHTHGRYLKEVGYHTRDYFRGRLDHFKTFPLSILAHSTHVKGIGTYRDGVEKPRVNVVLATAIPEDVCRKINLGYMNPDSINPETYKNREGEGVLAVRDAGEILYRLADGTVPDIDSL